MEKQVTAVEFLVEQLKESGIPLLKEEFEMITQALAIEKEQIINAYISGYSATDNFGDSEKYYNENFKTK